MYIGALQVVAWCPGIGIIVSIRKQNAVGKVFLRDRELSDLSRHCIFKVQDQRRVELTRVLEVTADSPVWKVFRSNLHIEGSICIVTISKQGSSRVAQHPVADIVSALGRRSQRDGYIHCLSGVYISRQTYCGGAPH